MYLPYDRSHNFLFGKQHRVSSMTQNIESLILNMAKYIIQAIIIFFVHNEENAERYARYWYIAAVFYCFLSFALNRTA